MAIPQIGKRISSSTLPRGKPRDKTGRLFADIAASTRKEGRPWVTLTYAQSMDGCIAARPGHRLTLSTRRSLVLTHRLRAAHDAILVGIGTVLADNPRLTVRLTPGKDPQPVVLDSQLRFPLNTNLLRKHPKSPWIVAGTDVEQSRQRTLEIAGARVFRLPISTKGHIELPDVLGHLADRGIHKLMVEGGAHVITSFLSNRMVDRVVLTLTPLLLGGLRAVGSLSEGRDMSFPRLDPVHYQWFGEDIVLWGEPIWGDT